MVEAQHRLVQARALSFAYPDGTTAVGGVDLGVAAGELVVLLGPNGSGKSTLLKLLGGLLAPDHGGVSLDGRPLSSFRPRERARRVAVVPQDVPPVREIRADAFVAGGRYAHLGFLRDLSARDHEAVRSALQDADAGTLGERLLAELSGGQRQRVLLARALAQEADLLLFDEPTASLDPDHQVRAFARIAGLVERGRGAVVATHDLTLASQFATRVALLVAGRIAAAGAPAAVLRREVLEPVYGPHLWYGAAEEGDGRPIVVPWHRPEGPGDGGSDG
ncbi:MAG: ABC transporter ATP-binding protein [Planctomycetota bacterium]